MEREDGRAGGFSFAVLAVSCYLIAVGLWLVAARRVRAPGVAKALSALWQRRYKSSLASVARERENCWLAPLPAYLSSDAESGSRLALFEDGKALGPAHASHDDIRRLGAGRYSHWGAQLYFSTSDNTDPRGNGRHYSVEEL